MNEKAKYRKVSQEQEDRITLLRNAFSNLYNIIEQECFQSRETSLAFTRLEEAQMWAIKGISREEKE